MGYQKPTIEPKILKLTGWRLSFARIHKAEARKDRKTGEPRGEKKFSASFIGDPTNPQHKKEYEEMKAEAIRMLAAAWGGEENIPDGQLFPFGLGNKLKKVYDGYKDMVYLKAADKIRPALGNRAGKPVVEGDPQCPYSGCIVNSRYTLWTFDNESSGVGANLRSIQFVKDGPAFGGGGERDPDEEFEPLLGDEPTTSGGGKKSSLFEEDEEDFLK